MRRKEEEQGPTNNKTVYTPKAVTYINVDWKPTSADVCYILHAVRVLAYYSAPLTSAAGSDAESLQIWLRAGLHTHCTSHMAHSVLLLWSYILCV